MQENMRTQKLRIKFLNKRTQQLQACVNLEYILVLLQSEVTHQKIVRILTYFQEEMMV